MEDLKIIFERTMKKYDRFDEKIPVLSEFIMGYRWLMSCDEDSRLSLALRVGKEKPQAEYESMMRSLIGLRCDKALEKLFSENDPELRTIAVSLCNLLGKSFNSEKYLCEYGIKRTEGLNFNYEVGGKKVGIIGYGLYNNFFLGKCAEFHAFDFRGPKGVLSLRIGKEESRLYPEGIHWHLGENAADFTDVLSELDIVIMTGCTIVNNSYRDILSACKKAQIRGIYGPSSELCPDYLFDLGYNYIFSASVKNKDDYLNESLDPLPVGNDLQYMDKYELVKMS